MTFGATVGRQTWFVTPFNAGFAGFTARKHPFGERFEAIQQSRVHCSLSMGLQVVCYRSPRGYCLDAKPRRTALTKLFWEMLRVMNAGSNENLIIEPAEFREL